MVEVGRAAGQAQAPGVPKGPAQPAARPGGELLLARARPRVLALSAALSSNAPILRSLRGELLRRVRHLNALAPSTLLVAHAWAAAPPGTPPRGSQERYLLARVFEQLSGGSAFATEVRGYALQVTVAAQLRRVRGQLLAPDAPESAFEAGAWSLYASAAGLGELAAARRAGDAWEALVALAAEASRLSDHAALLARLALHWPGTGAELIAAVGALGEAGDRAALLEVAGALAETWEGDAHLLVPAARRLVGHDLGHTSGGGAPTH